MRGYVGGHPSSTAAGCVSSYRPTRPLLRRGSLKSLDCAREQSAHGGLRRMIDACINSSACLDWGLPSPTGGVAREGAQWPLDLVLTYYRQPPSRPMRIVTNAARRSRLPTRSIPGVDPEPPVVSVFFRAVELLIARMLINRSWLAATTQKGYQTSGIRRNRTLCWYSA
jgi:hypothetical protein